MRLRPNSRCPSASHGAAARGCNSAALWSTRAASSNLPQAASATPRLWTMPAVLRREIQRGTVGRDGVGIASCREMRRGHRPQFIRCRHRRGQERGRRAKREKLRRRADFGKMAGESACIRGDALMESRWQPEVVRSAVVRLAGSPCRGAPVIEIVSATRFSESEFWIKTALGASLRRLAHDTRLVARIAYSNRRGLPGHLQCSHRRTGAGRCSRLHP